MFGKPRNGWIGIDVGTRAVKVAQVVRDADGIRVAGAAVIGRRHCWPDEQDGPRSSAAPSGAEISAAYSCGDSFSGRQSVCSLPMHVYDFRGLHLPAGSESERRTMISGELTEKWSELNEGFEFDYWQTETPGVKLRPGEPNINVLALATSWARQIAGDVAKARLQCIAIDGPPLVMARAIALIDRTQYSSPVAVVDWGYTSTTFCVVADSRPIFIRRIRGCGVRHLMDAIRKALGITAEQTQHLLDTSGLPNPKRPDPEHDALATVLSEGAAEPLRHLVTQLNRTLAYFQAQRRTLMPTKIWLLGGGASIRNADAYLSQNIETPVESCHFPMPDESRNEKNELSFPLFANAIGLSLLPLVA